MSRSRINVMVGLFVAVAFVLPSCRKTEPEAVPAHAVVELRGAPSCGSWTEMSATSSNQRLYAEFWLVGYLSGRVMGSEKDFLKGTDNSSINLWMDNYCKANPLEDIHKGADELAAELIQKKKL